MMLPQIKLFLSVDIAGSTRLKNSNSYYRIQKFCEENLTVLNSLSNGKKEFKLEDVYSQISKEDEHQDWSDIISNCFSAFNAEFAKQRGYEKIYPWKMAGDELIYCINVNSRKDVHKEVVAFFKALRIHDKKYASKDSFIRLKGSAWTAGFPIRNRIMFPLNRKKKSECQPIKDCPFSDEDYMGTEIDIGFRIGKHTYPGMLVVSLELACILLDYGKNIEKNERFHIIDTGWEKLKGVWDGHPYPIYWIEFSESSLASEIEYEKYKEWDKEENTHIKVFDDSLNKRSYISYEKIKDLIAQLPKEFNVNIPYFVSDGDEMPENHRRLSEFIEMIEKVSTVQIDQNETAGKRAKIDEKKIEDELGKKLDALSFPSTDTN